MLLQSELLVILFSDSCFIFIFQNKQFVFLCRMEPQESYFERLPDWVDDTSVEFEEPCSCFKVDANRNPTCGPAIIVNYPNESDEPGVPVDAEGSEGTEGKRRKRSTDYVDDLTDVDFDSFKRYVASVVSKRHRRSSEYNSSFTKQNATEYCMERLLNSEVGSLCSQIGADVQELVASCSVDVEVKSAVLIVSINTEYKGSSYSSTAESERSY